MAYQRALFDFMTKLSPSPPTATFGQSSLLLSKSTQLPSHLPAAACLRLRFLQA